METDNRDWRECLYRVREEAQLADRLERDDLGVQHKLRLEAIERAEEHLAEAKRLLPPVGAVLDYPGVGEDESEWARRF